MSEPNDLSQEKQTAVQKRFNWRGFFSLLLFGSFSLLTFSGIILYVKPKGRVANWMGWTLLRLGKEEWSSVHITLSLLVLIASGFHLYYNWSVFWRYIKRKSEVAFNLKLEMCLAILLCVITFFGTLYGIPPFSTIIQWNDDIKKYWEAQAAVPPILNAEELTLATLAQEIAMPLDDVVVLLQDAGIEVEDTSMKIKALAVQNNMTPKEIFAIIQPESHKPKGGGRGRSMEGDTDSGVENELSDNVHKGQGYGRMSVQQCCDQNNLPVSDGLARLKETGVNASGNELLKAIAERVGKTPSEIAQIIHGR